MCGMFESFHCIASFKNPFKVNEKNILAICNKLNLFKFILESIQARNLTSAIEAIRNVAKLSQHLIA
jgi:hypothetical protein